MKMTLENLLQLQELDRKITALRAGREPDFETEVREIEEKKAPVQGLIQPKYLSLYQRIADARGGIAVVRVRGTSCSGCHMILPPQFVSELARSSVIEQCPSCKRILVA